MNRLPPGERCHHILSNQLPDFDLAGLEARLTQLQHDLSNPLAIIHGNAEYLQALAGMQDWDEETVATIQDLLTASQRMRDELEGLRAFRQELAQRAAQQGH